MDEPHYFVGAYETRRGKRYRLWRRHLRNLAFAFAIASLAVVLMASTVSAYAVLASPFPLI